MTLQGVAGRFLRSSVQNGGGAFSCACAWGGWTYSPATMGWRAGFHPGYTSTAGFHHGFQHGLRPNGGFLIGTVTAYTGASMFVFLVYRVSLGTRALPESQRCITLLRGWLQGYTSVGLQAQPDGGVILLVVLAERRAGG